MLSLQFRVLQLYLATKKLFADRSGVLNIARGRADTESLARAFKPCCVTYCESTLAYGVPAEWIAPQGVESSRAVLFLHGGGYYCGSIASHRTLAANVALACVARSLLIDYRLAPEHPFPAALEDAAASYEFLLDKGYAPGQIMVAGDSAGGGLALALLIHLRDEHKPMPAAAIFLSPWLDLTLSGASWVANARKDLMLDANELRQAAEIYLRGEDPRAPLASPCFADLHDLPPLLIQVGSHELLVSDSTYLAERARAAGVEVTLELWPGMQHEWQFAAKMLPEAQRAMSQIGAFVEGVFSQSAERRAGRAIQQLAPAP
jgi:monoterpene epsilon-lactone hydrolase